MRANYIEDAAQWEKEFSFFVEIGIRFSETDMFGHMNNTQTFTYFEHARIEFLKAIGYSEKWFSDKGDAIPIVADLQCDYIKQVYFDEQIKIYVKVASMGKSSVDIHYMGKNEKGEIVFTGRGTVVQIGRSTGRPLAWSEEERELFKQIA